MEPEFPSNTVKKTEPKTGERQPLEKVVTGKVIVKKAGPGRRFRAIFVGEDGRNVASHVLWTVAIPAIKDLLYDAGQEALGRSLGIDTRGARRSGNIGPFNYNQIGSTLASRVNYNRPGFMTDPRDRQQQAQPAPKAGTPGRNVTLGNVTIDDIICPSRIEAEDVINRMYALVERYGRVTIADLFDLVGVTGEYTDENFGWVDLTGARPHRQGQGYRLDLPRPIQID
jgi:hypothetical protein